MKRVDCPGRGTLEVGARFGGMEEPQVRGAAIPRRHVIAGVEGQRLRILIDRLRQAARAAEKLAGGEVRERLVRAEAQRLIVKAAFAAGAKKSELAEAIVKRKRLAAS